MYYVAGAAVIGAGATIYASNQQSKAAKSAANAQSAGNDAAIQTQLNMYENMNEMLEPYRAGGVVGLQNMYDILGTNGAARQQQEINAIKRSPMYRSMLDTGENRIRANASATGNLRGGNIQKALAEFGPGILSQIIESQYAKYAGLAGLGENAAAQTGNTGVQTGQNIGTLQSNSGAARASGIIGGANAQTSGLNNAIGLLGSVNWGSLGGSGGGGYDWGGYSGGGLNYDSNDAMGLNSMYPSAYDSGSIF